MYLLAARNWRFPEHERRPSCRGMGRSFRRVIKRHFPVWRLAKETIYVTPMRRSYREPSCLEDIKYASLNRVLSTTDCRGNESYHHACGNYFLWVWEVDKFTPPWPPFHAGTPVHLGWVTLLMCSRVVLLWFREMTHHVIDQSLWVFTSCVGRVSVYMWARVCVRVCCFRWQSC